jgi:hypothetical protein
VGLFNRPTPGFKPAHHASGSQPINKPAQAQALQVNRKPPAFSSMPLATRPPNFPGTYSPQFPRPGLPIGNPIHIPSNSAPDPPKGNPTWETFTLQDEGHLYDPQTSAAEAEKALRQLVEDSHNDNEDDQVDMSLAIVEGFQDGITLLPHQVLGRVWMKERETGKKAGGILADDMGWVTTNIFLSLILC